MKTASRPSVEEFLSASSDVVAKVAPASLVFAPGGTRRGAALAGVGACGDEYAEWVRVGLLRCLDLIFGHGVENVFVAALIEKQERETTPGYREQVIDWIGLVAAGQRSLAHYQRQGWRVRLLGTELEPRLKIAAERLEESTARVSSRTLWCFVGLSSASMWQRVVAAAEATTDRSNSAIIRELYGEDVPPATLYLGFGKPAISLDLLPPLLVGELQCYWSQRPSLDMDKRQLREILYDYAYLRATWRENKSSREREALAQRSAWEKGQTVGLGLRLGPFWYPAAIEDIRPDDERA